MCAEVMVPSMKKEKPKLTEQTIELDGRTYHGMIFPLGNVPLLIVKAKKGYVACSYINKDISNRLGDVACFVTGVKSFDEIMNAKVRDMTNWAEELGIREGMSVKKALELMNND